MHCRALLEYVCKLPEGSVAQLVSDIYASYKSDSLFSTTYTANNKPTEKHLRFSAGLQSLICLLLYFCLTFHSHRYLIEYSGQMGDRHPIVCHRNLLFFSAVDPGHHIFTVKHACTALDDQIITG